MIEANHPPIPIEGLKLLQLKIYPDARGFFTESYRADRITQLGISTQLIQDNHSYSLPGVLRGLHCQMNPFQGKLVRAIRGRIWDVAVDLRQGSSTFGKFFGVELNDKNGWLLWIPPGFAHGFCVLGDQPADVIYKVDAYYQPAGDWGVLWNDPEIAIPWPIEKPILSEKDARLPLLKDSQFSRQSKNTLL